MARPNLPSKAKIIEYWTSEPGLARCTFYDWSGGIVCFSCGAEHPERAHIVPRQLGGTDTVDNLVLLCRTCHRDSPDSADPAHLLAWIVSGPTALTRAIARYAPEFERLPEGVIEDLTRVDPAVLKQRLAEVLPSFGLHGFETSPGTVAEMLRQVHSRLDAEGAIPAPVDERSRVEDSDKAVGLYHRVWAHESYEEAAKKLFQLVRWAEDQFPGKPRFLFLDIDGHRNEAGGFDADMFELQQNFVIGFLGPFLSRISMPLLGGGHVESPEQSSDVPRYLTVAGPPATGEQRASVRAQLLTATLDTMVEEARSRPGVDN